MTVMTQILAKLTMDKKISPSVSIKIFSKALKINPVCASQSQNPLKIGTAKLTGLNFPLNNTSIIIKTINPDIALNNPPTNNVPIKGPILQDRVGVVVIFKCFKFFIFRCFSCYNVFWKKIHF